MVRHGGTRWPSDRAPETKYTQAATFTIFSLVALLEPLKDASMGSTGVLYGDEGETRPEADRLHATDAEFSTATAGCSGTKCSCGVFGRCYFVVPGFA